MVADRSIIKVWFEAFSAVTLFFFVLMVHPLVFLALLRLLTLCQVQELVVELDRVREENDKLQQKVCWCFILWSCFHSFLCELLCLWNWFLCCFCLGELTGEILMLEVIIRKTAFPKLCANFLKDFLVGYCICPWESSYAEFFLQDSSLFNFLIQYSRKLIIILYLGNQHCGIFA